ncbi:DUF445 domain-containing protein [Clostridium sp. WILCCON 0269]|uniref:DUF445 domain-containing protein n=1 Tax=Candidatus Clostridium eludens TaxID=3381663 RepID=A0ABW8SFV7_9CLOT
MNRYKATIILVVVTVGYLASCPFYKTFWGGLISSAFCASMIGGFADWYGITALFKKPLGVPFKTEIIPKNREKIFDGLINMVTEELLSKEYLKSFLSEYDTSKLILKFLLKENGHKDIEKIARLVIEESINKYNNQNENITSNLFINKLTQFNLWKAIISSIEISVKNGCGDKIINFILEELQLVIKTENFNLILTELVHKTKTSYEKGAAGRAMVNTVVLDFIFDLSTDKISVVIQKKLVDYLNDIKKLDNPERIKFKQWLPVKLNAVAADKNIEERFEAWKTKQFKNDNISEHIKQGLNDSADKQLGENKIINDIICKIENEIYNFICKFSDSTDMQKKLDIYIKKILNKFIDNFHYGIGKVIRENLNRYSDDMLIDLIESKAGNDLQLIRINGSIVGGLVGILLFLLGNMF